MGLKVNEGKAKYTIVKGNKKQTTTIMDYIFDRLHRYADSLRAGRTEDRNPMWVRFSASIHTDPGAHLACFIMGTGCHSRGYSGPSVTLTTHHHLELRLKKE